jgi:hypothetical protein
MEMQYIRIKKRTAKDAASSSSLYLTKMKTASSSTRKRKT